MKNIMKKIILPSVFILFVFLLQTAFPQFNHPSGLLPTNKKIYESLPSYDAETRGEISSAVDYSKQFPPVGNQGRQNSCAAWAVAYVMSYLDNTNKSEYPEVFSSEIFDRIYSPSFIYNLGNEGYNLGMSFETTFYILKNYGCVSFKDMPYSEEDFCHRPSDELIKKASKNRIKSYLKSNKINTSVFKSILSEGFPVIVAVAVDANFAEMGENYISNDPYIWKSYKEELCKEMGYHAMVITGYDDSLNAFKVLNSYGKEWGSKGYVWISYDFIAVCIKEAYIMQK